MSALQPPPPPPPPGVPEDARCKNRLQQFTQKASMPLPMYETFNEGLDHAPQFRSQVWVDGTCYSSGDAFSTKKMAEQDAAKHALIQVQDKVKTEGCSLILEDTFFCKMIINEYAMTMNWNHPNYVTNMSKAPVPLFVSSLVLNGVTFIGDAGKNKKESEQFAARSAIISILGSESGTTMSEIVKSKSKFYDMLKKGKDSSGTQSGHVPAGSNQSEERGVVSFCNKINDGEVNKGTVNAPIAEIPSSSIALSPAIQVAIPYSTPEQTSYTQATNQSPHLFKRAETETLSATMELPIVFVHPASEQPSVSSISAKKRKRKNKKAKKNVEFEPLLTAPQSSTTACSMGASFNPI